MLRTLLVSLLILASPAMAIAQQNYVIKIDGMTCKFCAHNVKKHLKNIDGVVDVSVDQDKGLATLSVKPGTQLTDEQLKGKIAEAGYNYRGMSAKPE